MDGNLPYFSKVGTRAMGIGFLRRNEAGRHQKCRVTARKEMKHVKASSEDEEPLNTSLFFMKAIFEEAEKKHHFHYGCFEPPSAGLKNES